MPDSAEPGRPAAAGGRRPRVLLVDPYLARADPMERKFVELYPSLGLLTLGGYLRNHGVDVAIEDLTFARSAGPVQQRIDAFRPDLLGVHAKTLTHSRALEIGHLAQRAGVRTVAGGPDAATRPEAYLRHGFDAVATAEGEETLVALAHRAAAGEPFADIPGTATWGEQGLVRAAARPFLRNLDDLPLPAWDLLDLGRYLDAWHRRTGERRMAVLTSRGCPFDCSWCSKPTFGRTFRQQSPGRVMTELVALKERYGVDYVRFCDDVFGIQRAWLEELLDRMIDARLGIQFECLARVDLLKPDLLHRMRQAGLARVYLGVESGSQRMLDVMNRGTRLGQVERAAEALRREGVRQFWFLMLGYPGETLEDIEETFELFRRFSPEEYSVSIAVPVPGTRFYDAVRDRLTVGERATAGEGGDALLYEAAYPESLYRWERRRFRWAAALSRARGRVPAPVLDRAARALDRIHETVARPILLGRGSEADVGREATSLPTVPSRPVPAGPKQS